MALGFKIADGYVEVHARYDKNELQRAAQQAADDSDKAWNKEREANAKSGQTRDTNRRIGGLANKEFVKGVQEQVSRQKDNPFISVDNVKRDASKLGRVHVAEFHRAVEEGYVRQEGRTLAIGKRFAQHIRTGFAREFNKGIGNTFTKGLPTYRALGRKITGAMFGKDNAAKAGTNFFKAFVEAVTFGQADFSKPEITGTLTKWGARLGTTLGVALAGALVVQIGNAVTALLPVALGGALLALPIADLIFRNVTLKKGKLSFKKNEIGNAIKGFIRQAQHLADVLGKVFSGPFMAGLESATRLFEAIEKPLTRAVKAITPGAVAMWNGLLGAVVSFGKAMGPGMAGINAGLKQWGVELPKIGKAIGQAFAMILKNPALVKAAVTGLSNLIQGLVKFAAGLVVFLTYALAAWRNLWRVVNVGKNIFANLIGFAAAWKRITQAFGPLKKAILDVWQAFKKFATATNDQQAVARFKTLIDRIKKVWGPLKTFLAEVWKMAWAKIKEIWNTYVKPWIEGTLKPWLERKLRAAAKAGFKALEDEAKKWLKKLPGKAMEALKSLGPKLSEVINKAKDKAIQKIKDLVSKVVSSLKALPGKAKSAISSLASKIGAEVSQAATKAKQKAKELVDGFIKKVKELPGKAKAAVAKVKGAVQGALSAAGSWLVGAGKALMEGLAAGVRAGVTWVKNAAVTAAKAAVGAAKKALGISSPSKVFAKQVGAPIIDGLVQGLKDASPKAAKWLKKFFDRIADKRTTKGVVDRLRAIGKHFDNMFDAKNKALDKIQAKLKAQKDLLTQLRDAAKEYAKSISEAAVGDITQNISPGNIVGGLQARLASQTSFLANLEALKKLGLDQGALQQILDAGAGTGNAFAQALLSDPAQIAVVNELQAKLRVIGGKLGQFGSKTFHQAGIDVAKGLVKGLESQEKQLIKAIEKLAHKLVAAFKKKLGIHSPSTVMAEEVGKPSAQGIGEGLRKQLPAEMDSIRHLVPRSVRRTSDGRAYHTTSNWNPTINVHVAAGLDPVNAAARRALTKDIFLALEAYRKDYVR